MLRQSFLISFLSFYLLSNLHSQESAVAVTSNNYIYKGISNSLVIMVEGYKCDEIKAKAGTGSLKSSGDCVYSLFVPRQSKAQELVISLTEKGRLIEKHHFEVREVPEAKVSAGNGPINKYGGLISKEKLKDIKSLDAFAECAPNLKYEVTQFRVTTITDEKNLVSYSSMLTEEQLELLSKLESGDRFFFENIKVKGPDGYSTKGNAIVFKIK